MAEQDNKNHKTIVFTVDRIIFHDKTNGRVIIAATREEGKPCRVIGYRKDIVPGEILKATGTWEKDEKYSWQFIADKIHYKEEPADDGLMHASDFSNVHNNYPMESQDIDLPFDALSQWERGQFIDENLDELLELILEKEPRQDVGSFEGEDIVEVLQMHFGVSAEELLDSIGDIDSVRDMIEE